MDGITRLSSAHAGLDDALVRAAANGDRGAFAALVAEHHADIVRACHVVCGDIELTRDAVQSAWHVIWRKLGQLREPGRFRSWAIAIAVNEARMALRKDRRRLVRELALASHDTRGLDVFEAAAERIDLGRALATLQPDERVLLALRYVAGFTPAEIVKTLGGTESGIRGRLSRINVRLREEMR